MTQRKAAPFEETLYPYLQNDEKALASLNECLEDEDIRLFLSALKDVAEARGVSMARLSQATGLHRVKLYKMLSQHGNPKWSSLRPILKALGFKLSLHLEKGEC